MGSGNLTKSALIVWVSCVIYAVGMIAANYVAGNEAIVILLLDIAAIAAIWVSKLKYRLRLIILLASLVALHLAVLLRPDDQPVGNLWLVGLSFLVFIISLFVPRSQATVIVAHTPPC